MNSEQKQQLVNSLLSLKEADLSNFTAEKRHDMLEKVRKVIADLTQEISRNEQVMAILGPIDIEGQRIVLHQFRQLERWLQTLL